MASVVNSRAEVLSKAQALTANLSAAAGLGEVLKTNLGPRGTLKMLVGGAGQIKITKDGCVLLSEMAIQHPTAMMIARAATAQDSITGDGTTTAVLFIAEMLKQSERYLNESVHPQIIAEGFDLGKTRCLEFVDKFTHPTPEPWLMENKELALSVARTSVRTKLMSSLADSVAEIAVEAVRYIKQERETIDLHMVEMMNMKHKTAMDTTLVKGLVLDHGSRHPDMPTELKDCYVLTCNVSMEYEKTEVNSGFFYNNADQRDALVASERKFVDNKVRKLVEFKRKVCTEANGKTFVVINQKGIDPPSLDSLCKEGIIALRRAKRRNMERLTLACGGNAVNSFDDLDESDLGRAGHVFEKVLGEDKYTFVEEVANPQSVTVLVRGPNDHTIHQIKDAVQDGLRAVRNLFQDESVIPGGGAFQVAAYHDLMQFKNTVTGKKKLGIEIFANALLCVPKTLAANSGFDIQDSVLKLLEAAQEGGPSKPRGLDVMTGDPMNPVDEGVFDNTVVIKQLLGLAPVIAQQFLLVDEVLKAGRIQKG